MRRTCGRDGNTRRGTNPAHERSAPRPEANLRRWQPRQRPLPFRSCSQSAVIRSKLGLVASYSRPGGYATGINILTNVLAAKRLGLLRELVSKVTTVGFLINPIFPTAENPLSDMQEAAHAIAVQLHVFRASTDHEIDTAFRIR